MDLGAIFLLLGLVLLVGLFVARPFMERQRHMAVEDHALSSLMADRDRILNSLQELDFDHTLGKIPAEEYPAQRASLLQKGAEALRQLDTLQPPSGRVDANARLEAAIAVRRGAGIPDAADDELEALIARRRQARKDKTAGFCPKCGKPALASDRFCPACGRPLK
ncbi:MAG: zinc-ribbon domain-containing protein [Chloroflexi bacterium]|nr:zinc-ribbon domain-containing protein [Chloroflexota bacterium]